jgi:hypothetical protein
VQEDFKSVEIPSTKIAAIFVLILTANSLANETIINEGLKAFVNIAKLINMDFGYVGASMLTKLLGNVKLTRSVPIKGTQRRKGLPAPATHHPALFSDSLDFGDHRS